MIMKKLKINFSKYIFLITFICLTSSNPAISLNYENYDTWVDDFLIQNFKETYNIKFIRKLIKIGKLDKKEFYKIDKIVNEIYDKDFINPEHYFNENRLQIRSKIAKKFSKTFNSELLKIEKKFGIPISIILSIWGIESDFGNAKLEFSSLKAIIFHIYNGKRKKYYKNELVNILKIIKDNKIDDDKILGSSYGAMGQPQFMPSSYNKYGFDFNNDGKVNLWNNEGDILASIASFLSLNGWKKNLKWGFEIIETPNTPCYVEGAKYKKTIKNWRLSGIEFADKKGLKNLPLSIQSSLLMPKGEYGPKFLVTNNFYVLKKYNFSDFYALYVGTLANLIEGKKIFHSKWKKTTKLNYNKILKLQNLLLEKGFDIGKLDGLIGFKTRRAIGKYQENMNQKITCYPN